MVTEKATTTGEQDTVNEEEISKQLDNALNEEGATSDAELETEPEEGEEKEPEPEKEDDYEKTVTDLATKMAQKMTGKATQTIERERDGYKSRVTELESQLSDLAWDITDKSLFEEDEEKFGEEQATKKQKARAVAKTNYDEYLKNNRVVETFKNKIGTADVAAIDEICNRLEVKTLQQALQKTVMLNVYNQAFDDFRAIYFPDDKKDVKSFQEELDKVMKFMTKPGQTWDDYNNYLEMRKGSIFGKKKKFVPDSSQGSGGGGVDLSQLSPRELMERGYKKQLKK